MSTNTHRNGAFTRGLHCHVIVRLGLLSAQTSR